MFSSLKRCFATVAPGLHYPAPKASSNTFDNYILDHLRRKSKAAASLPRILQQYSDNAGHVLSHSSLPYESRPSAARRVNFTSDDGVLMVIHAALDQSSGEYKLTSSSGFPLNVSFPGTKESLILTCSHTLEEIHRHPLLQKNLNPQVVSGTFILQCSLQRGMSCPAVYPASAVVSSLPRSDLLLLKAALPTDKYRLWPLSPYPSQESTPIMAHLVVHDQPSQPGWEPWISPGTWSKWVAGQILGYRDFAGRETQPGTYDALSHMLFEPIPSPGSSGGPVVDTSTGAVVGIISGSRLENRVVGMRGWGTPSEAVFEMFSLPGLEGKR